MEMEDLEVDRDAYESIRMGKEIERQRRKAAEQFAADVRDGREWDSDAIETDDRSLSEFIRDHRSILRLRPPFAVEPPATLLDALDEPATSRKHRAFLADLFPDFGD